MEVAMGSVIDHLPAAFACASVGRLNVRSGV